MHHFIETGTCNFCIDKWCRYLLFTEVFPKEKKKNFKRNIISKEQSSLYINSTCTLVLKLLLTAHSLTLPNDEQRAGDCLKLLSLMSENASNHKKLRKKSSTIPNSNDMLLCNVPNKPLGRGSQTLERMCTTKCQNS